MTSNVDPPATPDDQRRSPADPASGSPMGMVALGSMILIGTYVVFGLLLNDYWVGWLAMLLAVSAVLIVRRDIGFVSQLASVPVLVKMIGYLLAIIGVLAVVEDLRFADGTLNEFPDVIGALAAYAGYVFAFLGARSIRI